MMIKSLITVAEIWLIPLLHSLGIVEHVGVIVHGLISMKFVHI